MLPTLPLPVAVAVTTSVAVPLETLEPVVKPSKKVPLKVPSAALIGLAAVAATPVMPERKLENAAATCSLVEAPVEVNVKPFSVTFCPAVKALNVMAEVSAEPAETALVPVIPETPTGVEGVAVSMPKPKSMPSRVVLSYQTERLRPSMVFKVKPPPPPSPAVTPWTAVPALILSITY